MIRIYHNPRCSTSRKALETLQATGRPVEVVEYLRAPPPRDELRELIRAAGLTVREALRAKEPAYETLGLSDPALTDEQLLDAIERLTHAVEEQSRLFPKAPCRLELHELVDAVFVFERSEVGLHSC